MPVLLTTSCTQPGLHRPGDRKVTAEGHKPCPTRSDNTGLPTLSCRPSALGPHRGSVLKFLRSLRSLLISSARTPKTNTSSTPVSSAISMLAPSQVPMMRQPFIWNFMLDVPDASVPVHTQRQYQVHEYQHASSLLQFPMPTGHILCTI